MSDYEEKRKALNLTLNQIEKQFGKGSVMLLGDGAKLDLDVISTGSLDLDIALGIGGVPRGRIIEILDLNPLVRQPWPYI